MHILIAGGGIGGLTLALALHKRGIACTVHESVPAVKPLGVGINLLPHAVKELTDLGLQDALAAIAIETSSLTYYNRHGQLIWSEPRGRAAGYAWPQFSIHRGELHMLLLETARRTLVEDRIVTGHALEGFTTRDDGVTARFRNIFDGTFDEIDADVLVAADGIHSAARRQMWPDEGPARYGQRVLWRAITDSLPFGDGRSMFMAGSPDVKFVSYPISRKHADAGRSLINWIAELRIPGDTPPRQDWNREVSAELFADHFKTWRWPWIDIPALIEAGGRIYEFPLVDRDPLPHWREGRVTLMGDAAHPMYPIGSNGASQAILDVRALSDALLAAMNGQCSVEAALERYESERRPKTAAIVLANRGNGPEQVMKLAEDRAPDGFVDVHDVIPQAELEGIAARYKQVAGFDKMLLNQAA